MIKSITVSSTNILLKEEHEQETIIENFKKFLNTINGSAQILFTSSKYSIRDKKTAIKNLKYDKFIKKTIAQKGIMNREFKVVLSNDDEVYLDEQISLVCIYFKQCGLICSEVNIESNNGVFFSEFNRNYVLVDKKYCKTFYIKEYPRYSYCGWMYELYSANLNYNIGMFIESSSNYDSIKYLDQKAALNFANSSIDEDNDKLNDIYDENIASVLGMREEIFKNEGKMFFTSVYITIKSETLGKLKRDCESMKMLCLSKGIKIYSTYFRQDDGYRCSLPINFDFLNKKYNLTTKSLKYFFPFLSSHIVDKDGVMIGENLITPGLIFLNPFKYNSALMFVLGKVGGGKTYTIQLLALRLAYMNIEIDIWDKTGFEYKNILKLTNLDNIRIHHYQSIAEYENEIKRYVKQMNNNKELKQRFLIIDEGHYFVNNSEIIRDQLDMVALTGRKFYQGMCFISQMIEHINDNVLSILRQASIKILMQMEFNEATKIKKELNLTESEVRFLSSANQEGILIAGNQRVQFKALASKEEDEIITTDPSRIVKRRNAK